jgi:drug/metabolite transporter (DMT)-like permease
VGVWGTFGASGWPFASPANKLTAHHRKPRKPRSMREITRLETNRVTLAGFVLLLITAACMSVANLLIKHGIEQAGGFAPSVAALFQVLRQPAALAGVLLAGLSALMWFYILASQKLSTCYPLFVSLTYSFITVGAFLFLHERMSLQKLVGLAVIIVGITTVARG